MGCHSAVSTNEPILAWLGREITGSHFPSLVALVPQGSCLLSVMVSTVLELSLKLVCDFPHRAANLPSGAYTALPGLGFTRHTSALATLKAFPPQLLHTLHWVPDPTPTLAFDLSMDSSSLLWVRSQKACADSSLLSLIFAGSQHPGNPSRVYPRCDPSSQPFPGPSP